MKIAKHIYGFVIKMCFVTLLSIIAADVYSIDSDQNSPEYYEVQVRKMFAENSWEKGKELLDKALKLYPEDSSLNELAGRYFYNNKQYDNARYFLIKSVKNDPENIRVKHLLINLEEATENYSSAVCYVNELLEITPYSKELWKRKIALYRRIGNNVEADRLLRRLYKIYSNDKEVSINYEARLEENYFLYRKNGEYQKAIEALEELLILDTSNETYFLDLCNLLLQQGCIDEALRVANMGAEKLPQSVDLAVKKASILSEKNRYAEALSFIEQRKKVYPSPVLQKLYVSLLNEAALASRKRDPYLLYGQAYVAEKNEQTLNYLIDEAIRRGYYEEALGYIREARVKFGETSDLLYKEYQIYKMLENSERASSLLEKLYRQDSLNYDIALDISRLKMQQAISYMNNGFYAEAVPELYFVLKSAPEKELKLNAWSKLYTCHIMNKEYMEAETVLEDWHNSNMNMMEYIEKKVELLCYKEDFMGALSLLDKMMNNNPEERQWNKYVVEYEDLSLVYIKKLIENGALYKAFDVTKKLLVIKPSSREGLIYAISIADMLEKKETVAYYLKEARENYPHDIDFIMREASMYYSDKRYSEALGLLRPLLDTLPGNRTIVNSFSANSELLGYELLKEKESLQAMNVVDSALIFDKTNSNLLYLKGIVYEQLNIYDSAYYFQKKYKPLQEEYVEYKQKLNRVLHKTYQHELSTEYMHSRYSDEDIINSIAIISYAYAKKKNCFMARVNYTSRRDSGVMSEQDVLYPDGIGIQLTGGWSYELNDKWTLGTNIAWANRYLPSLTAQLFVTNYRPNDWEIEARIGLRNIHTYNKVIVWDESQYNEETQTYGSWVTGPWEKKRNTLINMGIGAYKTLGAFRIGGMGEFFEVAQNFYANLMLQARFYPLLDGNTQIILTAAAGSAPDMEMIDYAMPGAFDRFNATMSMGGIYMFTPNLSMGLTGEYHTFYTQSFTRIGNQEQFEDITKTSYKNLLNFYVHLSLWF